MESDSDALVQILPSFRCETCRGNMVYRGTQVCFNCQNGGAIAAIQKRTEGYKRKKPKQVKPTQQEIQDATNSKIPTGNLPPLK